MFQIIVRAWLVGQSCNRCAIDVQLQRAATHAALRYILLSSSAFCLSIKHLQGVQIVGTWQYTCIRSMTESMCTALPNSFSCGEYG